MLALRWYAKGIREQIIIDKFLAFWICFEILTMEGTTNVGKAKHYIRTTLYPDKSIDEIDTALEIGKFFGIRSKIMHQGDLDLKPDRVAKLQEITEEVLRAHLSLKKSGKLDKYFVNLNQ